MLTVYDFKHKITVKVRFNEIDILGVCNNSVYITYFEEGRIQYMKHLGIIPPGQLFADGSKYYIVRNEVNYRGHAIYDDELDIYTRVSFIKNSSYGFEHLIYNRTQEKIITDGAGVIVKVDPLTGKSTDLDDSFMKLISNYDTEVKILK